MNQQHLKELFALALEYKSPAERGSFLAKACKDDPELRQEVESLLRAHEQAGALFDPTEPTPPLDFALEPTGARIGRYRLLEQIGEGGFGVVYMAEQEEPVQRKVALKIIKAGMDTKEVIARFEAERQALALMDHPNIARVLDGGTTEAKRPYFVMEMVRGIPITDYCDREHLSTPQRLKLFIKVCQAVQHAHQKAVIHRDLKPSNILVTLHDGEPVPKVIDFGVAKALGQKLTEKTLFTSFRQMIGTPAYMSPEQAEMSGLDVDTRSDIYSLGVLLYELLTGVTPFDKETLAKAALDEIRRMIREIEPPKPSTRLRALGGRLSEVARHRHTEPAVLSRLVRGDLDWIVMKCLEKDRTRRYETANGLAMDLKRFLNHEPVTAAAPTFEYRLVKFARRHQTALLTIAAFVLLLVGGTVFSVNEALKARQSALEASQQAAHASRLAEEESRQHRRATEAAAESRTRLRRLNLANGNRLLEDGDYFGALTWFAEALGLDKDQPDKEPIDRLRLTTLMKQCPRLLQMWFHHGAINSAEFSRDGQQVVTASEDRTARIWDVGTGQPVTPPLQHPGEVVCARFSPDGQRVLTAACDQAYLWNAQNGQLEHTLEHLQVEAAGFSPDGRLAATAGNDSTIKVWDVATGRLAAPVLQHRVGRRATQHEAVIAFSPDGRWLVSAAYDKSARVWNATTGEPILSLDEDSGVRYAQFSPDSSQVATATWGGTAHLWDRATGQLLLPAFGHQGMVDHVGFSSRGEFMVSSSLDGTAKIWDARNGRLVHSLSAKSFVMASTFSPDGEQLLIRDFTGQARTWSVKTGQPTSPPLLHGRRLAAAQFHPDGRRVLTGCLDGSVRLWDLSPEGMISLPWGMGTFSRYQLTVGELRLKTRRGISRYGIRPRGLPMASRCLYTTPFSKPGSAMMNSIC